MKLHFVAQLLLPFILSFVQSSRSLVFLHLIGIQIYRCNLMLEKHARSNEGALRGHEKTRNFRFCIVYACIGKGFIGARCRFFNNGERDEHHVKVVAMGWIVN